MLIKIGNHRINFAHVTDIQQSADGTVYLHNAGSGGAVMLIEGDAVTALAIWDQMAADQITLQSQIEAVNKQSTELQAKAQEIAAYEQQLMQKAAQVDAAYAAMHQQKSPVILPPGFGRKQRG